MPCMTYILDSIQSLNVKATSMNAKLSLLVLGLITYISLTERTLYKQNKKIKELSEKE